MIITDEDVIQLRNKIAPLYGEDLAHDAVVRILSGQTKWTKSWFAREVWRAKRAWQREQIEKIIRQGPPVESLLLPGDTTKHLEDRIECRRLFNDSKGLRIIRYVIGQSTESRQRIEQLRKEIRNG